MGNRELANLIEAAIAELTRTVCPNCQTGISPEGYLCREDIEKWLEKRKEMVDGT